MSGLEVTGIVLGAIPLLISTLEHYGEGLSTLQRWRKYERELRSLTRNLETERVKLQDVCEKLLIDIVPPSRIESMINDPMGDAWREKEVQRKVETRLWKGYHVFEATIEDIKVAVDEMSRRINSQRGGTASELRRVVFTLRRSYYDDVLSTIRDGISSLENLTDRNIELEPARRVRFQGRFFGILREMSKSLYRALRFSLDCTCKHDLGLRLECRSIDIVPSDDDDKVISDLNFWLAVSFNDRKADHSTSSEQQARWEQIAIKAATLPRSQPLTYEIKAPPPPQQKLKGKRTVRFAGVSTASASRTIVMQTETTLTGVNLQQSISGLTKGSADISMSGLGTTLNLCEMMRKAQKQVQVDSYGTIIDQLAQTARRYAIYPVPAPTCGDDDYLSFISLRDILERNGSSLLVPYRDRLNLAVVISSSILQLHGSPWLPATISSRDIFFTTKGNYPIYDSPFLIKVLPDNGPTDQINFPLMRNPTLLSLGLLLIELIMGKTIDSMRTPEERNVASSGMLVDYITAQRLLDQVRMASSYYGTAVSRCVDGDFHTRNLGLDNVDFCQEVYAGVVALLEKDLKNC
ncbi:hypothetical protein NKR23_g6633 [Pleurostoma richardsiae]|uniref:DUF7580 domain-containing protein n=1 Tax=Pleurostoma richardsiae TaxID=41990 RepID=A0AA38VP08_9PEZI|nr:hypothetical protein NKR23_g6633 [Pleurostoma richardsiae]